MTSVSSVINVFSYDYDWMPNIFYTDEFDVQQTCNSINQLGTHGDVEKLSTNHIKEISQINSELNQYYSFANEMPTIEMMTEIDSDNFDTEDEWKWKDKLKKHRKSSNFGFSSLQKRIERVKNDIINLTNKLNSGYVQNGGQALNDDINTYYNLGFGNIPDNDLSLDSEEMSKEYIEMNNDKKTWKCPSQFNSNNPYSDLSENTQKILNKYHLNEDSSQESQMNESESIREIEDLEMEEDDIEFTFCTTQNGLLHSYLSRGTLPVIQEEEEEICSSSEEDTESIRSTIIENLVVDMEVLNTPNTISMQSMNITDSDSYVTAISNPLYFNQMYNDKTSSFEETDENLSDYARYSASTHSSKESLNSYKMERLDNGTSTDDQTMINHESSFDYSSTNKSTKDCSSSVKLDRSSDSDAEYDNSTWSNEDILQSMEQSDSLYEKPVKHHIKSSLPDLIESTDCYEMNNINGFFGNRNLSKSTDLDEILLQQPSPCNESRINRLSTSLCNLNINKSDYRFCPQRFFQDTLSQSNLLETDLDSGFVSIYQPIKETEILPPVNFTCSMVNINQEKSPVAFNSLAEKLKSKAGSIPELRVANSLNKLNVPDWLNFRQDNFLESSSSVENTNYSFTVQSLPLPSNGLQKSPIKQVTSLSRPPKITVTEPPIKPQLTNTVILPSQRLKQSTQRKLAPMKSCKARELLLPNKIPVRTS